LVFNKQTDWETNWELVCLDAKLKGARNVLVKRGGLRPVRLKQPIAWSQKKSCTVVALLLGCVVQLELKSEAERVRKDPFRASMERREDLGVGLFSVELIALRGSRKSDNA